MCENHPVPGVCPGSAKIVIAEDAKARRTRSRKAHLLDHSLRPPRLRALRVHIAVTRVTLLLIALMLALPVHASVVTVGDARFPAVLQDDSGRTLELKGAGLARYAVFIRVYGAGLYGPQGVPAQGLLEQDERKRLEIEYFVDIEAADLARAADTILERQLEPEDLNALAPRITRLHQAYRSVGPGDRYIMEYVPGRGTQLRLNGESLITIEGRDFARAYFGIWLGDRPLSSSLRDALLGSGPGR